MTCNLMIMEPLAPKKTVSDPAESRPLGFKPISQVEPHIFGDRSSAAPTSYSHLISGVLLDFEILDSARLVTVEGDDCSFIDNAVSYWKRSKITQFRFWPVTDCDGPRFREIIFKDRYKSDQGLYSIAFLVRCHHPICDDDHLVCVEENPGPEQPDVERPVQGPVIVPPPPPPVVLPIGMRLTVYYIVFCSILLGMVSAIRDLVVFIFFLACLGEFGVSEQPILFASGYSVIIFFVLILCLLCRVYMIWVIPIVNHYALVGITLPKRYWVHYHVSVYILFSYAVALCGHLYFRDYYYFYQGKDFLVCIEPNPGPRTGRSSDSSSTEGKQKKNYKSKGRNHGRLVTDQVLKDLSMVLGQRDAVRESQIEGSGDKSEPSPSGILKKIFEQRELDNEYAKIAFEKYFPYSEYLPRFQPDAELGDILKEMQSEVFFKDFDLSTVIALDFIKRSSFSDYPSVIAESSYSNSILSKICCRSGKHFPDIDSVELVVIPLCILDTFGLCPWRDTEDRILDNEVIVLQPMIRITMATGREIFQPIDHHRKCRTGRLRFESSIDDYKDHSYFPRMAYDRLINPNTGEQMIIFRPLYVSKYLLGELYYRRVLLSPKLSQPTMVERLIRFASEDDKTSTQLELRLYRNISSVNDTISFLTGLCARDMRTGLEDF
jgi:hypothetical protein